MSDLSQAKKDKLIRHAYNAYVSGRTYKDENGHTRAKDYAEIEKLWLALWEACDFSWESLADAGWDLESTSSFWKMNVPGGGANFAQKLKQWCAPLDFPGEGKAHNTWKEATLQDYWRYDPLPNGGWRKNTDAELIARGLLIEKDGKLWHALHCPEVTATPPKNWTPPKPLTETSAPHSVSPAKAGAHPSTSTDPTHGSSDAQTRVEDDANQTSASPHSSSPMAKPSGDPHLHSTGAERSSMDSQTQSVGNDEDDANQTSASPQSSSPMAQPSGDPRLQIAEAETSSMDSQTQSVGNDEDEKSASSPTPVIRDKQSASGDPSQPTSTASDSNTPLAEAIFSRLATAKKWTGYLAPDHRVHHTGARAKGLNACWRTFAKSGAENAPRKLHLAAALSAFGDIFVDGVSFGEATNFSNVWFGESLFFNGATFDDGVDFRNATFCDITFFNSATFGQKANFNSATFCKLSAFRDTFFGDETNFSGATFGDSVSFDVATFGDETSFDNATFGNRTRFHRATFGDKADFNSATFRGAVIFTGAPAEITQPAESWDIEMSSQPSQNDGDGAATNTQGSLKRPQTDLPLMRRSFLSISFENARFSGDAIFSNRTFLGETSFDSAKFSGLAKFHESKLHQDTSFRNTEFAFRPHPQWALDWRFWRDDWIRDWSTRLWMIFEQVLFSIFSSLSTSAGELYNKYVPAPTQQVPTDAASKNRFKDNLHKQVHAFTRFMPWRWIDPKWRQKYLKTINTFDQKAHAFERSFRSLKLAMERESAHREAARFFRLELKARAARLPLPTENGSRDVTRIEKYSSALYGMFCGHGERMLWPLAWLGVLWCVAAIGIVDIAWRADNTVKSHLVFEDTHICAPTDNLVNCILKKTPDEPICRASLALDDAPRARIDLREALVLAGERTFIPIIIQEDDRFSWWTRTVEEKPLAAFLFGLFHRVLAIILIFLFGLSLRRRFQIN